MTDIGVPAEDVQPVEGQGVTSPEAQPQEGQGQEDFVTGLYDLNAVPEPIREQFAVYAKDLDKKIQQKFTEAAEYRKNWEPYQELGITDYEPDSIKSLLAFAEALNDDETARSAIEQLQESLGFAEDSETDPTAGGVEQDDPLGEVRSELAEFREWKAQQEQEFAKAEELDRLTGELDEVEQMHGKPLTQDEKIRLVGLAGRMPLEDEPIKAAYSLISEISGSAEQNLVKSKARQPRAAMPGGRASTAAPPVEDFAEAQRLMQERRRTS